MGKKQEEPIRREIEWLVAVIGMLGTMLSTSKWVIYGYFIAATLLGTYAVYRWNPTSNGRRWKWLLLILTIPAFLGVRFLAEERDRSGLQRKLENLAGAIREFATEKGMELFEADEFSDEFSPQIFNILHEAMQQGLRVRDAELACKSPDHQHALIVCAENLEILRNRAK